MPAGLRHAALLLAALALCPVAALLIGDDPTGPVARMRVLIDLERDLGVHVEPAVHAWTADRPGLLHAATAFYLFAHVPVAGWALIWTWYLRRDRFRRVRDTFLWLQAGLVVTWVLLPTAPPHLVPGAPFGEPLSAGAAGVAHVLQSPYAAMPSGHVAFALVAGAVFVRLGDRRWLRAFGWIYPPLVVVVTVMTANHLLVDAAGAAVAAGTAYGLARGPAARAARAPRGRRTPVTASAEIR